MIVASTRGSPASLQRGRAFESAEGRILDGKEWNQGRFNGAALLKARKGEQTSAMSLPATSTGPRF
ncbi:MAG: hypothetical protein JWL90_3903 [Chthoniobacteraceae bacterium]|nr:hypothetical protein [Chthoniobacteraceae bacterium]